MNPEISVILPYFNAEETLYTAIKSILDQTFPDFELLLVDNNSTDNSCNIARDFSKTDERIRLLAEPKHGVANAMNCGLQNATGHFLARMDADDVSHPKRLQKQVEFLNQNPEIGLVGSSVKYIPHEKNTEGFHRFVEWANSFHSTEEIELKRFMEIPVINPTILFRREIYEQLGGCLHGNFPEDFEMQLRYLEAGVKMAKLDEPLLEWHDYSTRLTRTDKRYSTKAFFRVKANYFAKWSQKNNPFHPEIWVWGAGRRTRKRAKMLEKEGLIIKGYFDIVRGKTTEKLSLHFTEIPLPGNIFVVPMVSARGATKKITDYLLKVGHKEGSDFIVLG